MIIKRFTTQIYLIIFVIIVASVLRITGLGNIPYGFANDEVGYIFSGYTIGQTWGHDINGHLWPLSVNLGDSLSPVPVYAIALLTSLFGLSPFISRLPFALMGIGSAILIFFICLELFEKEKVIGFICSLVFSLSSWNIFITRGVWDVVPALFFYLLGFYIFLRNKSEGNVLWSLPAFLLGFYSYHATKVFFPFFVFLLIVIYWRQLIAKKMNLAFFITGLVLIMASFILIMKMQSVTRQNQIIFINEKALSEAGESVKFNRAISGAPKELKYIVSNKVTYLIQKVISNYLGAFSPQFLVLNGGVDAITGYGMFIKGVIYLIDLPFLFLGIIFLFLKSHIFLNSDSSKVSNVMYGKALFIIVGSLLIAPLPSAVGYETTYIIRSFMMIPFLSILIGLGIYSCWGALTRKKKLYGIFYIFGLSIIYMLFVGRFLYQYYYQFNLYGGEFWNVSSRQLSEYISKNDSQYDKIIVESGIGRLFLQYAFFSKANAYEVQKAWYDKWPAILGKVTFVDSCGSVQDLASKHIGKILYAIPTDCEIKANQVGEISDPMEFARKIWRFYN
jgi:4-amino-4-deoxy-L-arabinose transferase-like glycosyltransferase